MKRVLFFSPYMLWAPHLMWETLMAMALQQRGAEVKFVNCSGLNRCGMSPRKPDSPPDPDVCRTCMQFSVQFTGEQGIPQEFLTLPPAEQAELRAWVDALPVAELKTARYQGQPIGEWIYPDMVVYHLDHDPDVQIPEVEAAYRDYLYGAALVVAGLPGIIERYQPDAAVMLNGSFFLHRTALELLRQRGVRVITHERGYFDKTLMYNLNEPVWHEHQISGIWEPWKTVPLRAAELVKMEKILGQRRQGRNMGSTGFSPRPQQSDEVLAALGLSAERPIALMCTTIDHETSQAGWQAFVNQDVWNHAVIQHFAGRTDVTLVIRTHPYNAQMLDYERLIRPDLERLQRELPPNIKLVMPHDPISTYTLMDLAALCITYGSTVGLEMACMGLPVVHAGRAMYKDAGFTLEVNSLEELPLQLERALCQGESVEVARLAYRFAYHSFFGLSHPMNHGFVSKDYYQANLNLKDHAELAPGKDPDLDRLTAYILGEVDLLYPAPSAERLEGSPADEDRFLAEQRLARQIAVARARPEQVDLLYQVGLSLREMGLTRESASVFATVVARRPDHIEAQRELTEYQRAQEQASHAV